MPEPENELSLHFPTIEENDCFLMDSTQVSYENAIYPNLNAVSKAGMKPYNPTSGADKTAKTIVDSKFIITPKGQNSILENDMVRLSSSGATSTLALYSGHADDTGTTLGIKFLTDGDLKLDKGDGNVKNIKIGVPETDAGTPSQEIFFASEKDVILSCEDSSIVLNHETGMTDYFATTIDLLPPED